MQEANVRLCDPDGPVLPAYNLEETKLSRRFRISSACESVD